MSHSEISMKLNIDYNKINSMYQYDVIPVVAQEEKTKQVLIIAYTNKKAFDYTIQNKIVAFWSTSRNELWIKGATSGEYLSLKKIFVNCEQNSLLYVVSLQKNGICHVKNKNNQPYISCFFREVLDNQDMICTM